MANKDAVFGARVVNSLLNTCFPSKTTPYTVLATDATALFVGDFVKLTGTAGVGHDGKSRSVVTQAAAGDTLVGFVGTFAPDPNYLNQIYRTASTLRTANVYDDPFVLFEIQASGTLAEADIGNNADITVGAGDTDTGISGMEVDLATKGSATAQIRIMGLSQREDNDFGANANVIGMINEHTYKSTTGV